MGLSAGLNLFTYVNANPLRFIDPRGLELGEVACFNGQWEARNYNQNKCTRDCTDVHEAVHLDDLLEYFGPNACRNVEDGRIPDPGARFDQTFREYMKRSECRALKATLVCVEEKLNDCPGSCERSLKDRKIDIETQIFDNRCS